MRIISNEYIFPLDDMSCHASVFLKLDENRSFAVWFYGTAEGNDDVCIYGALRDKKKWGEPKRLTANEGLPHWNPVLKKCENGDVMLFYKVGKLIADWHTEVMVSHDGCESFGESFEMVAGDRSGGRGPVRNKIIELSDNSWLAGGSTERGEWKCFFDRSTDGGLSWQRSEDICLPNACFDGGDDRTGRGIIQPTLWESKPGCISALMRSTVGNIYRTDSDDFGVSWCEPYPIQVKNNNSGIDITKSEDGTLYLVCNPVGLPEGKIWGRRSPLSILVSHDNGVSFEKLTELATGQGVFAYPSVNYENGRLYVTYTWNRKLIMFTEIEL